MAVWGVSMFRDEQDVAYHTLMHMGEEGLAGIIVADNLSVDGTRDSILRAKHDLTGVCEVFCVDDDDPGYYQAAKMTRLAAAAAERGATWVVPFDADELWLGPDRVGVLLEQLEDEVLVATAGLYNHFPTLIDPEDPIPFRSIEWRQRDQGALPKVAFRWREGVEVLQGNHGIHHPSGAPTWRQTRELLQVRHFPYRTWAQFRRKAETGAAAYAATDLPESEGAHWRQYGALLERGEEHLRFVFETYFWFRAPVEAGLVRDPAPFRRWTRTPA